MVDLAEFYKKYSILEIYTLVHHPSSRRKNREGGIAGVQFQNAYVDKLQREYPFCKDMWDKDIFSKFKILYDDPPKQLTEQEDGSLKFKEKIVVEDWDTFIDSFRQVRNNISHGAKYLNGFQELGLDERGGELVEAALSFIEFLEKKIIKVELH